MKACFFSSSQSLDHKPPPRACQWSTVSHSVRFLDLTIPLFNLFQSLWPRSNSLSSNHGHTWVTTTISNGLIQCSWLLPLRSKHLMFNLYINAKKWAWRHLGVTHVPLVTRLYAVIKTMPRMWIQLLCACVLYSMRSRVKPCPNMGICDVNKSHGWNARFWLVEKKFAALWLVRTYRGHYHYWRL